MCASCAAVTERGCDLRKSICHMSKICERVGSRAGFVAHPLPYFLSQFLQNSHRYPLQWHSFKQNKKDKLLLLNVDFT